MNSPKRYDGVAGLAPRKNQVVGVVSIGLKRQVLQDWAREHPGYQLPKTSKGKTDPVMFKGDPAARFFIKIARGDGPQGSSPMQRYRPMLSGFEAFNLDENGDPAGQDAFYGFLPAGEITKDERGAIHAPFFRRERRAQKLGRMVPGDKWEKFERVESYRPLANQQAPSGRAECRGNGVEATRWMPGENGAWGWHKTPCLGDDCPFAAVCKVSMEVELHSQAQAGHMAFLRYENKSANTTANFEGWLHRLYDECEQFQFDKNLYWLPFRMQIEMVTKSAGIVHGKQLPARRFSVVSFGEMENVASFKASMAKLLSDGGGRLALPVGQSLEIPADEALLSAADFEPDPPEKPRAPPADDVIDVQDYEEKPKASSGRAEAWIAKKIRGGELANAIKGINKSIARCDPSSPTIGDLDSKERQAFYRSSGRKRRGVKGWRKSQAEEWCLTHLDVPEGGFKSLPEGVLGLLAALFKELDPPSDGST